MIPRRACTASCPARAPCRAVLLPQVSGFGAVVGWRSAPSWVPRIVSAPDLISSVVSTPLVVCLLLVLDCSSGRVALLPLDRVGVSNSGKLFMRPQPGAWRALHRTEGFSPRICLGLVICAFTLGITGITATLYGCIVVNVNLFVLVVLLLHCLWPLPVFKLLNTSGCKRPL